MIEEEKWKPIDGYEEFYEVSTLGRVKSLARIVERHPTKTSFPEKILKQISNGNGYFYVHLSRNNLQKRIYVHRLVAIAFIPNHGNKPQVNHKSGKDNVVSNLEWVTPIENMQHAFRTGAMDTDGRKNHRTKYKPVSQYDGEKFVTSFPSIKDAAESTGIFAQSISNVLSNQRKTAGGFKWKRV